jgi:hypothetical protein
MTSSWQTLTASAATKGCCLSYAFPPAALQLPTGLCSLSSITFHSFSQAWKVGIAPRCRKWTFKCCSVAFGGKGRRERADQVGLFGVGLFSASVTRRSVCSDGWTPLHWAAEKGRSGMARLLLQAGADVNVRERCHTGYGSSCATLRSTATALHVHAAKLFFLTLTPAHPQARLLSASLCRYQRSHASHSRASSPRGWFFSTSRRHERFSGSR